MNSFKHLFYFLHSHKRLIFITQKNKIGMTKKLLSSLAIIFCFSSIKAQDSWTVSEWGGFGNSFDQYIESMIPFKGNLYAGTGNTFNTGGVFRSSTGNMGSWTNVLNSPVAYSFDALTSTTEGGGYLYASSYSSGSDSSRIYKSFDGTTWTPYFTRFFEPLSFIVPFKGLGSVDSIYVIENNFGGAKILRSDYSSNDPANLLGSWQTVADFSVLAPNTLVTSTLVHSGRFYIGTNNGAQLWSSMDGVTWTMNDSVAYGFNDVNNNEITALEAFGGYIYAGTYNSTGAQLWRTPDQLNWTLVRTYTQSDMITDLEITGSELWIAARNMSSGGGIIERTSDGSVFILSSDDGFGEGGNHGEDAKLSAFGNNMYYGLRNFDWAAMAGPGGPTTRGGGSSTGGQIWRTCLIAPPTLNIGNDTTLCSSQSITLDAGPGAISYYWNTEDTVQTISAGPGNYFCQITAASGCDAKDFLTITALTTPTLMVTSPISLPAIVCKGNLTPIMTTAVSGLYIMDPPFIKVTNDTISNILGDAFDTLNVSGVSGSCACTSLISVTIDSIEHEYMGDVIIGLYSPSGSYIDLVQFGYGGGSNLGYYGTEFRLDAATSLGGATPPFTGQFLPDEGFDSLTGAPNGNWILKVGDTYAGDNGNLKGWTLKFGYADTIMTFSWTPATGLSSTTTLNTVATPLVNTTYTLTATNAIGCPQTTTVQMDVPSIQITPSVSTVVCYGGNTTLTATGGINYYWSPATELSATLGATVVTTPTANIEYLVLDTVAGCEVKDSIYVFANPQLFVTASLAQTICFADTALLTANGSGGTAGYTYNWNDGATNTPGQNINVSPTVGTSYTLTVTDTNGCMATDFTSVSVTPSTDLVGHVSYSGGNVTNGNVVAYKYIPTYTYFDTVQVTSLNASGDYTFTGLNSGDYLIKVFANEVSYPTLNPTYYGGEWAWDSASVFVHGCSIIDTANIVMIEEVGTGTGAGMLTGTIVEGVGFGSALMVNNGFMRAPGEPIPGIDVKLGKNPGGAMVASGTTNTVGVYTFAGIDVNVPGEFYTVYVDIPGLGRDSSYSVTVTATTNQFYYLDYYVDSTTIYIVPNAGVGISNVAVAEENKFGVYPNPSNGNSTIEYTLLNEANVSLNIYNVLGVNTSELVNKNQKAGTYKYSTRDLNLTSGIYFITLITDGKTSIQRLIITE